MRATPPDFGATPPDFARELSPAALAQENQTVTMLLYERLGESVVAEVQDSLDAQPHLDVWAARARDPATRPSVVLTFGMWLGIASVAERSGLSTVQPPEDIHVMARGPLAAAGGVYDADMIVDALASAGVGMDTVGAALDFGCSSGRVVRVLAASYPSTRWLGCDPNKPAIEWAAGNLPGISFFASSHQPPLELEDGSLDLAYAISIWSHFAPELGLRWFDEMHRLIRPGGHLVMTTHGLQSLAVHVEIGLRSGPQGSEIKNALDRRGWWYAAEFGAGGDWGVVNPEWGTAFLSPEWVITKLCPRWQLVEFAPGRNQTNQDVYVLRRA